MAHASEEAADMASIASALVLNIGTLTIDFIDSMIQAARAANLKGIPVVLDVCGAGATRLRDEMCFRLMEEAGISVIKGNASEIARIAGENVATKGVDSGTIESDPAVLAADLAVRRNCVVVVTGKEDIVTDGKKCYRVANGHEMMSRVVGTGCMAASAMGTFAAVAPEALPEACAAGLCCFEIAAELAVSDGAGPGSFMHRLHDRVYSLTAGEVDEMQRVEECAVTIS